MTRSANRMWECTTVFFFFQAEDGIRDVAVTGVQTCALPIYAGYSSPSRVYERAHLRLGMTPATYRRGAAGVPIAYTVVPCPLGQLLVAATERGLCRIGLGSGVTTLEAGLGAGVSAAQLRRRRAGRARRGGGGAGP